MVNLLYLVSAAFFFSDPRDDAFDNMFLGCYGENPAQPDFEHFAWDKTATGDATIENCVHACRTRAFAYAAMNVRICH